MCGENQCHESPPGSKIGSSPRVRGKRGFILLCRRKHGLIPACAGKTTSITNQVFSPKAHPRVCGENLASPNTRITSPGSSPRVRGKPHASEFAGEATRLIPACAGKTEVAPYRPDPVPAHPRVCGENPVAGTGHPVGAGSSPRVRGKLSPANPSSLPGRLIPACAGKTCRYSTARLGGAAHPRVCGENPRRRSGQTGFIGSSPRVRGKPLPLARGPRPRRLIPACAGKTAR